MTDQEIYKILRIDGEERDEFIDSLEGDMIHRAFEINEMISRAYENNYLDELDREYNFDADKEMKEYHDKKIAELESGEFADMMNAIPATPAPEEDEEDEEEVEEEVPQPEVEAEPVVEEKPKEEAELPSEDDAPSYEQESNDASSSNFEESGINDGNSLFEVDKGPVSDMALDRLMKEAELISNSAHKDGE